MTTDSIGTTGAAARLLLALVATAGGCRATTCPDNAGAARPGAEAVEGVPNYAKVSDALHRGGQPTKRGFAELSRRGIRAVVSLRVFNIYRKRLAGHGFRHYHISFKHIHPEDEDVLAFLAIVSDPRNQPVFVHCREGVDRTGMMVAVYRMVVQGWSKERALAEMKDMGFNEINEPIEDYIEDLDVIEVKCRLPQAVPPRAEVIY
jgi:protein tyrosine phosphatase (PTP) superfamily phosphohydrolase (DUF442 family)